MSDLPITFNIKNKNDLVLQKKRQLQLIRAEQRNSKLLERAGQDMIRDNIQPQDLTTRQTTQEILSDLISLKHVFRQDLQTLMNDEHEINIVLADNAFNDLGNLQLVVQLFPQIKHALGSDKQRFLTGVFISAFIKAYVNKWLTNKGVDENVSIHDLKKMFQEVLANNVAGPTSATGTTAPATPGGGGKTSTPVKGKAGTVVSTPIPAPSPALVPAPAPTTSIFGPVHIPSPSPVNEIQITRKAISSRLVDYDSKSKCLTKIHELKGLPAPTAQELDDVNTKDKHDPNFVALTTLKDEIKDLILGDSTYVMPKRGLGLERGIVQKVGFPSARTKLSTRKVKYGTGIAEVEKTTPYAEFGKFVIHTTQLENQSTLNAKYKSFAPVPTLPRCLVSPKFATFLMGVIENSKINQSEYNSLTEPDKQLFNLLVSKAGLAKVLGTNNLTGHGLPQLSEEDKRFQLVRGEVIAGNNSPLLLEELKKFILKFIAEKKIEKTEGLALLSMII